MNKTKNGSKVVLLFILCIIVSVIFPFVFMLIVSLKDKEAYLLNPYGIFDGSWTFDNYLRMLNAFHVRRKVSNSCLVAMCTATGTCLIAVMAAYSMLFFKKVTRSLMIGVMLLFIFMPTQVTLSSKYELFLKLNMVDSLWTVILLGIVDWVPTSTLLLFIHFQGFDKGVISAARLDGCGNIDLLAKIIIPLSLPAIAIVFINVFTGMWNSFLEPMLFLRSEEKQLLIPSLAGLVQRYRSNLPFQMSGYVIGMIPSILVYTIFKNQLLNGFENQYTDM